MDRRTFISAAGIAAVGAASACSQGADGTSERVAAPAVNRGRTRRLRMVTTWPPGFPGLGTAAVRTAELITQMSGGSLVVEVYGAGEIVGAFEVFDAVSNGVADMYHAADYYWQGRSPAFNFYCAVPLGMTPYEIMAWVEYGGGQELWNELSNPFNIQPFQAGNTGHQMGGWFKREINTLEDFRGLRMRIPGLGGNVIRELGGAAVALSGGEIYQSLQSGAIDATEWVGPGTTWPSASTVKLPIITVPDSTSRARPWRSGSIWASGNRWRATTRRSCAAHVMPRTIRAWPNSITRTDSPFAR